MSEVLQFLIRDINKTELNSFVLKLDFNNVIPIILVKLNYFENIQLAKNYTTELLGVYSKIKIEDWFGIDIKEKVKIGNKRVRKSSIINYIKKRSDSMYSYDFNLFQGYISFTIQKEEIDKKSFNILLDIIGYFNSPKTTKSTLGEYLTSRMGHLSTEHLVLLNLLKRSANLNSEEEHIAFNLILKSLISINIEKYVKHNDLSLDILDIGSKFTKDRKWINDVH